MSHTRLPEHENTLENVAALGHRLMAVLEGQPMDLGCNALHSILISLLGSPEAVAHGAFQMLNVATERGMEAINEKNPTHTPEELALRSMAATFHGVINALMQDAEMKGLPKDKVLHWLMRALEEGLAPYGCTTTTLIQKETIMSDHMPSRIVLPGSDAEN